MNTKLPILKYAMRAGLISACLMATACSAVNPMELLPSVDRLVLQSSREKAPKASAISVEEMLAGVRAKGEEPAEDEEALPKPIPDLVVTLDKDLIPPGIYQSLAGFLSTTSERNDTVVVVTRSASSGIEGLNDLRRAEKLGRMLNLGGREVRLAVSDEIAANTFRIGLSKEAVL